MGVFSLRARQALCVSVFSMAVPFVQDWDLVQTLGEGAYGEYVSTFIFIYNLFFLFGVIFKAVYHQVPLHSHQRYVSLKSRGDICFARTT